ncbi:MAG: hypothetical protein WB630_12580 [Candidatus Acidiferrales bacterium]
MPPRKVERVSNHPNGNRDTAVVHDSGRSTPPAAAVFSFLKQTKGLLTWTAEDLSKTLKLKKADAEKVLALLAVQGYIKRHLGTNQWITTIAGEEVSQAKSPRFSAQSVHAALTELRKRIAESNLNLAERYKITDAVAFGDFMNDGARVQAADVGIRLEHRKAVGSKSKDNRTEREFLKVLRANSALLNIKPFEPWMRMRTHLDLL